MTDARVSRVHTEALVNGNPVSRISRVHTEALVLQDVSARISRLHAEALTLGRPDARISRFHTEALISSGRILLGPVPGSTWSKNSVVGTHAPADVEIVTGNNDTGSVVYSGAPLPPEGAFRFISEHLVTTSSSNFMMGVVGLSGSTQADLRLESTFTGWHLVQSAGGTIRPYFNGVPGTAVTFNALTDNLVPIATGTWEWMVGFSVNGSTITLTLWVYNSPLSGPLSPPVKVYSASGAAPASATVLPAIGAVNGGSFGMNLFIYGANIPTWDPAITSFDIARLRVLSGDARAQVYWDQHPTAASYDYRIDGGTIVNVAQQGSVIQSLILTGMTNADHTIEVRARNGSGVGPWHSYPFTTSATGYLLDDFQRSDSTTVIGSPTQGGPYTTQVGTWGILGNSPYISVNTARSVVTAPAAADIDLKASFLSLSSAGGNGLIFRYSDASNYWYFINFQSTLRMISRKAGTETTVWQDSVPIDARTRHDDFRIIAIGKSIWFYRNGVEMLYYESLFNSTATQVGIYSNGYFNAPILAWLSVTPPPADLTLGRASGVGVLKDADPIVIPSPVRASYVHLGGDVKALDPVGFA